MIFQRHTQVFLIDALLITIIAKGTVSEQQYKEGSARIDIDNTLYVHYNGMWGTVCHDGWDRNDADVVCKELGYQGGTEYTTFRGVSREIPFPYPVWLSGVSCKGSERYLADCQNDGLYDHINCGTPDIRFNVVIGCNKPEYLYPRLYNGPVWYEGQVSVWNGDNWANVCSENFGINEASTVCKQLGLSTVDKVYDYNKFAYEPKGFGVFGSVPGAAKFQYTFNCSSSKENLSKCALKTSSCRRNSTSAAISCRKPDETAAALSTVVIVLIVATFVLIFVTCALCSFYLIKRSRKTEDPSPVTNLETFTKHQEENADTL